VTPATYEELRLIGDFSLAGHRHYMPDHGLFVAGIIHTLAPKAELHLYEVLNPYGVGCVLTIVKGLLQALDLPRPLIVNCSLVLDLPDNEEEEPDFPSEFIRNQQLMEYLQRPLQDAFDLLALEGAVVVAAAGNDAQPGPGPESVQLRPRARVPARFPNVIGVGALPKGKPTRGKSPQPASYSNLADDPTDRGYVVLGGEDAANQGIVGVYLNPYPQYRDPIPADKKKIKAERFKYIPNQTGWAEWAGTSFATPVLSGLLAVKWSEDPNQTTSFARTFLDSLVAGNTDNFDEKAIYVEQTS
jgi:subtilisin family serine protease